MEASINPITSPNATIPASATMPPLMTPKQSGDLMGVSTRTVARLCESGKLKAVKVGTQWRINRDALLEFAGLL